MAMSRQRMLPPDIFTDELLMGLPLETRWTAVGLRMNADDHGRESANPLLVKAAVWPLDSNVTNESIEDHMLQLDELGYIAIYNSNGRTYYAVSGWAVVSHAQPSRIPKPPLAAFQRTSGGSPVFFSAGERGREQGGERGREQGGERDDAEGEWEESPAGIPPSPFCKLHQPGGTKSNCRHCGTARLAQEQWHRQHRGDQDYTAPERDDDDLPY